jgi:uncharacterized protein YigA (DUF484 family)
LPTEQQVKDYLRAHPDFLARNPDVLELLAPPSQELGENISDFQQFAIRRLQEEVQRVRHSYEQLVTSAQDNTSVQRQVHKAIVDLIRARGLEQLLEVLTLDLVTLFNVDVVRLAMETDFVEHYETHYSEGQYSGIVFVPTGVVDAALADQEARLVSDAEQEYVEGFEAIFSECAELVKSCALLRLRLSHVPRQVVLAFGVRHPGHFHARQAVDLLMFLAVIVQERLDTCLIESGMEPGL